MFEALAGMIMAAKIHFNQMKYPIMKKQDRVVAETIYNTVEKNYPVLVYELPGTENTAAADKDAAGTVISAIDEIGEVTLESADAISSARSRYGSLSDTAKSFRQI